MKTTAFAGESTLSNWRARLELGFEKRQDRTVLARRKRYGPLAVQRPFYPEAGTCHVYILHPPGGVVGGDELSIEVTVDEGAKALLTTPGASKYYRSNGAMARQFVRLKVAGQLEWLPQENILFRGANLQQKTQIDLRGDARFIGAEIHCLGRPANGEIFDTGQANISMQLLQDGVPLQIETSRISPGLGREGPTNLRGYPVTGVAYATPVSRAQLIELRASVTATGPGDYFALTLIDDLLIARFLGASTSRAQQRFIELWKQLRPLVLLRPACVPRIWNT